MGVPQAEYYLAKLGSTELPLTCAAGVVHWWHVSRKAKGTEMHNYDVYVNTKFEDRYNGVFDIWVEADEDMWVEERVQVCEKLTRIYDKWLDRRKQLMDNLSWSDRKEYRYQDKDVEFFKWLGDRLGIPATGLYGEGGPFTVWTLNYDSFFDIKYTYCELGGEELYILWGKVWETTGMADLALLMYADGRIYCSECPTYYDTDDAYHWRNNSYPHDKAYDLSNMEPIEADDPRYGEATKLNKRADIIDTIRSYAKYVTHIFPRNLISNIAYKLGRQVNKIKDEDMVMIDSYSEYFDKFYTTTMPRFWRLHKFLMDLGDKLKVEARKYRNKKRIVYTERYMEVNNNAHFNCPKCGKEMQVCL